MKNLDPFRILLLLLSILFIPFIAQGQEMTLDEDTDRVTFTEVVQVEGVSAEELYSRGMQWFAESYKSSNEVLQMDDPYSGKLIGKAWSQLYIDGYLSMTVPIKMWYTIKVFLKDGRYKYDITDIEYEGEASKYNDWNPFKVPCENFLVGDGYYKRNGKPRRLSVSYSENTQAAVNSLVASLKLAMESNQQTAGTDEDW